MPFISPVESLVQTNYERSPGGFPAFYLAESNAGVRGLIAKADPKNLRRVQKTPLRTKVAWDEARDIIHCIYWPRQTFSVGNHLPGPIPANESRRIQEYFSEIDVFAVGDEEKLDAAIANHVNSVRVGLWDATSTALAWLPCHRVVHDVEWFEAGWMVCLAREHLFFRDVSAEMRASGGADFPFHRETAERLLRPNSRETVTMLAVTSQGAWRIHSERGWADGLLEHLHPALREVPVVQLLNIVLLRGLNLAPTDGSQERHVHVVNSTAEAVAKVRDGAQVAYLLNPIGSEALAELVKQGQMLPEKSVALNVSPYGMPDAD